MRLIDADALKEAFGETRLDGDWCIWGDETTARDLIDAAPTVDPVEHGHWVVQLFSFDKCGDCREAYCSVCGEHGNETPFCAICGAIMDGEPECKYM